MKLAKITTCFKEFLQYKEQELLKKRTITDYKNHFGYLNDYLKECGITHPEDRITKQTIRGYALWMKKRGYKVHTINIRIVSMKCFFNWLYNEGFIEEQLSLLLKKAKEDSFQQRSLTLSEQAIFLKKSEVDPTDTASEKRTKYFLRLLYFTGLRPNEAISLRYEDIDFLSKCIIIKGEESKTSQSRVITTWDEHLEKTIVEIKLLNENNLDYKNQKFLFPNLKNGSKLNYGTMRSSISKLKVEWGIKKLSAYAMRHTFAANMQVLGPGNLKQVLGHKSFRSTERYFLSSPEIVQETFNRNIDRIIRLPSLKQCK